MLQNAYLLANFGFDTAENELTKKLQKFAKILTQQIDIIANC